MAIPELPPAVREHLSRPINEPSIPEGARVVDGQQLGQDLGYVAGSRGGDRKLQVEAREDPIIPLKQPISLYGDRRFFYAGLLYGYCRIDASITERCRAELEHDIDTRIHQVDHSLVDIPAFPDFKKTRVSRMLQSVYHEDAEELYRYIASQVIVDRPRERVWAVEAVSVQIPDPYLVDQKESPSAAEIIVFCPRTFQGAFVPKRDSSFFISSPNIVFEPRLDNELRLSTEAILGG